MAIYSKGQKGYAGPYSADDPDFVPAGRNLASYPNRDPSVVAGGYGPPDGGPLNGALDCSSFVDPQVADTHGFDNARGAAGAWRKTSSDSGLGGFSGPMKPRGGNHPKKGMATPFDNDGGLATPKKWTDIR